MIIMFIQQKSRFFLDISGKSIIFAVIKASEYDRKNDYLLSAILLECSSTGTRNY